MSKRRPTSTVFKALDVTNVKNTEVDESTIEKTTVRMTREIPSTPGGPLTADVHPDMVTFYASGGWTVAE